MTVSLEGKSAIVTGAAVGIGNAFARALAIQGVNLSICDIRGDDLQEIAETLDQIGIEVESTLADVSVPADVRGVVDKHISRFGGIDLLVSNAGTFPESMALEKITNNKWALDIEINLGSHHKMLRECIPYLKYGIISPSQYHLPVLSCL